MASDDEEEDEEGDGEEEEEDEEENEELGGAEQQQEEEEEWEDEDTRSRRASMTAYPTYIHARPCLVARRGFRPLHGATPVLVTWALLCILCVVVVCVPSQNKRVAAKMGPFKDYRARAALNTALLFASGALELLLRLVLKRRQRQAGPHNLASVPSPAPLEVPDLTRYASPHSSSTSGA